MVPLLQSALFPPNKQSFIMITDPDVRFLLQEHYLMHARTLFPLPNASIVGSSQCSHMRLERIVLLVPGSDSKVYVHALKIRRTGPCNLFRTGKLK